MLSNMNLETNVHTEMKRNFATFFDLSVEIKNTEIPMKPY